MAADDFVLDRVAVLGLPFFNLVRHVHQVLLFLLQGGRLVAAGLGRQGCVLGRLIEFLGVILHVLEISDHVLDFLGVGRFLVLDAGGGVLGLVIGIKSLAEINHGNFQIGAGPSPG